MLDVKVGQEVGTRDTNEVWKEGYTVTKISKTGQITIAKGELTERFNKDGRLRGVSVWGTAVYIVTDLKRVRREVAKRKVISLLRSMGLSLPTSISLAQLDKAMQEVLERAARFQKAVDEMKEAFHESDQES